MHKLRHLILILIFLTIGCNKGNEMITAALSPRKLDATLDPRKIYYTSEFHILENLLTRLVAQDENGEFQKELASEIKSIDDLEFYIKIKDASFSNGETITLVDVKESLERTIKTGSAHVKLDGILDFIKIENDSLVIRLKKKSKSFIYFLSLIDMGILHKTQYQKEILTASDFVNITSGPFTYLSNDKQEFFLKKNRFYKFATVDYPELVHIKSTMGINAIKEMIDGKIDLGQVKTNDLVTHEKDLKSKDFVLMGTPSDTLSYILFNKNSAIFRDKDAREWIIAKIQHHFILKPGFEKFAKRSFQYFPPESRAYLQNDELGDYFKKLEKTLSKKPAQVPNELIIKTFTTAFNVGFEPLLRELENIPDLKIKIENDVKPNEISNFMRRDDWSFFLNFMASDYRISVEAINFEYFSPNRNLIDTTGKIEKLYEEFQTANSELEEQQSLKKISMQMLSDGQFIPLCHSVIPVMYNPKKIDLGNLSHFFIFNFWKLKAN